MFNQILALVLVAIVSSADVKGVEQCEDIPTDIEFYAGPAPGAEFAVKEIGSLIGEIMKGLEGLIKPANFTFPEDMWNSTMWNMTDGPSFGPGPIAPMQDAKPPTNPLGDLGKTFKMPNFAKQISPLAKPGGEATGKSALSKLGLPSPFAGAVAQPNLTYSPTLDETPDDSTVWGISVPINTLKVELAKIASGKVSETHTIDAKMLSSNKTVKDINKFVQYIDLSDWNLKSNDMFIVCLLMSAVKNDKQVTCQRCVMLRVCDSLDAKCAQRFVTLRAPDSKVHPYAASLQYWILEPPMADMKLQTIVKESVSDARCAGANVTMKKIEKVNKIFSNTVVYVDVPDLSPKLAYTVKANLIVTWGDKVKVPFGWSNPLTIPDYLDSKSDFIIFACSQDQAGKP